MGRRGSTAAKAAAELDAHQMDLYSRQIGAYGVEAMGKLIKMKVLIIGLRGVGVETAKNLMLAGPGEITLCDSNLAKVEDMGVNFFVSEENLGQELAKVVREKLSELNRLVKLSVVDSVSEKVVKKHTVVIDCTVNGGCDSQNFEFSSKLNRWCRASGVKFIKTGVLGAFGFVFDDFGSEFSVKDLSGEQPVKRIVDEIDSQTGVVRLLPPPDGKRHNLEENSHEGFVRFEEVEGLQGIDESKVFRIAHCFKERRDPKDSSKVIKQFDAYAFKLLDFETGNPVALKGAHERGTGRVSQVKQPVVKKHKSLKDSISKPVNEGEFGLLFTDGSKFGRAEVLHAALDAMFASPANSSVDDLVETAKQRNVMRLENLDENVLRKAFAFRRFELQPLCAFFGGVAAQEAVKATGKFTPLNQWLHVDAFEIFPSGRETPTKGISTSRYYDLEQIVSVEVASKIRSTSTFLVGCGALGCEFLKNYALIGLATSAGSEIVVTDNDRIEVSNLSRQFLFREHNVGQPKSIAASKAASEMNSAVNLKALESLVSPDTEDVFDDDFWLSKDVITNALDNVKARNYVDSKCVLFKKPLLESGTLGTKCNVQLVLPGKTASYSDGPSDGGDDESIPMCTLRNFPSQIEHCVEWARARFNDSFFVTATEAANFLKDPKGWIEDLSGKTLKLEGGAKASAVEKAIEPTQATLDLLTKTLGGKKKNTFENCVADAFEQFHRMFRDKISSLISTYPKDAKDREGAPFWSGTKRFPVVAEFDSSNPTHMQFVVATANLLAVNRGLVDPSKPVPLKDPKRDVAKIAKVLKKLKVPPVVKQSVDMSGGGEEDGPAAPVGEDKSAELEAMLQALARIGKKPSSVKIEPCDFEKDADWNFHIDYIDACSNLRAFNYRLKPATRHESKMIAGKIIPAIATTTAAVCGLVTLELIKLVQPNKPLSDFKDSSNNLGINAYFFSEPQEPLRAKDEYDPVEMATVKCVPQGFSKWDTTEVSKCATLQDFLTKIQVLTNAKCTAALHPLANKKGSVGYSKFLYEADAWQPEMKAEYAENLTRDFETLVRETYGLSKLPKRLQLDVNMEGDDEEPIRIPSVIYTA